MKRILEIPIVNDMVPEKDECFEVELFNPTGGARLGPITKMAVTITNDEGSWVVAFRSGSRPTLTAHFGLGRIQLGA